jgi:hypothetical protein
MCFTLYAGTTKPIPRKEWRMEAPDISVAALDESQASIRAHFGTPEVQCIGSTSCCGCDFPNLMYQNGGWPVWPPVETDPELLASDRHNRQLLVDLLKATGEANVELYGVWWGDSADQPRIREDISLATILMDEFYFKHGCFYLVRT